MKAVYSESSVLSACLELLTLRGITAWRNNSGCSVVKNEGKRRFIRYGLKGSSDILGVLPGTGRFLAIETKRPAVPALNQRAGTLRGPQREFLWAITDAGGVAVCVSDVVELSAVLDKLAIDPRATFDIKGEVRNFTQPEQDDPF